MHGMHGDHHLSLPHNQNMFFLLGIHFEKVPLLDEVPILKSTQVQRFKEEIVSMKSIVESSLYNSLQNLALKLPQNFFGNIFNQDTFFIDNE